MVVKFRKEERPGKAYLKQLLSERNQHPERTAQIDEALYRAFQCKVAILVLDMSGFSELTKQCGIIHFLAMIHQMEQGAKPAIVGNGGQLIKQEADNLFAIFDHSSQALEAALDIFRSFEAMNTVLPDERDIYASVGIGYGDTLVIGDDDLFGSEMNAACKLGEDCAGAMEILLTPAAYEALPPDRYLCAPDAFAIGGLKLDCYRYRQRMP